MLREKQVEIISSRFHFSQHSIQCPPLTIRKTSIYWRHRTHKLGSQRASTSLTTPKVDLRVIPTAKWWFSFSPPNGKMLIHWLIHWQYATPSPTDVLILSILRQKPIFNSRNKSKPWLDIAGLSHLHWGWLMFSFLPGSGTKLLGQMTVGHSSSTVHVLWRNQMSQACQRSPWLWLQIKISGSQVGKPKHILLDSLEVLLG